MHDEHIRQMKENSEKEDQRLAKMKETLAKKRAELFQEQENSRQRMEEQNRAVSAFELPQFRHSMSVSLAFEVQSRCGCRETVRLSRREADLSSAPADFAR